METKHKALFGAYSRERQVFISRDLRNIEIYESVKLFGITVWEKDREVFVPPFADLHSVGREGVRVILDAYLYLYGVAKDIKGGRKHC
ncbi:hypothetical protein P9695_14890 [Weizmannia sp. CD-2023]|uniref:hypothetical protein n=1 Tax=Heyndrickxia TaxID=2837504 RepID=UPI002E1EC7C9|nr:hypothetical protein [Weizmannia sp. CD-2023]MED4899784.1 hypothetical protein [Weizmannia sp. CD-2023]